jgi:hypothetical protein
MDCGPSTHAYWIAIATVMVVTVSPCTDRPAVSVTELPAGGLRHVYGLDSAKEA